MQRIPLHPLMPLAPTYPQMEPLACPEGGAAGGASNLWLVHRPYDRQYRRDIVRILEYMYRGTLLITKRPFP